MSQSSVTECASSAPEKRLVWGRAWGSGETLWHHKVLLLEASRRPASVTPTSFWMSPNLPLLCWEGSSCRFYWRAEHVLSTPGGITHHSASILGDLVLHGAPAGGQRAGPGWDEVIPEPWTLKGQAGLARARVLMALLVAYLVGSPICWAAEGLCIPSASALGAGPEHRQGSGGMALVISARGQGLAFPSSPLGPTETGRNKCHGRAG